MKTIFLFLLFLISTLTLNAQETDANNKWSYGVELNPTVNSGIINLIDYYQYYKPKYSLNVVLKAYYKLNDKSSLSLGLGYSNIGEYRSTALDKNGEPIKDYEMGWCGTGHYSLYRDNTFSSHHNIQIPLSYRRSFFKRFFINSGISGIINFSNELVLADRSKRFSESNVNYRILNFSAQLGLGYNFYKSEKMTLYVQPTIERYAFILSKKNEPMGGPGSLGLVIGAKF